MDSWTGPTAVISAQPWPKHPHPSPRRDLAHKAHLVQIPPSQGSPPCRPGPQTSSTVGAQVMVRVCWKLCECACVKNGVYCVSICSCTSVCVYVTVRWCEGMVRITECVHARVRAGACVAASARRWEVGRGCLFLHHLRCAGLWSMEANRTGPRASGRRSFLRKTLLPAVQSQRGEAQDARAQGTESPVSTAPGLAARKGFLKKGQLNGI